MSWPHISRAETVASQRDTQEPTGKLMSHVWRISGDEGKKAGQAKPELFPLLREAHGFGFPSFFPIAIA